MSHHHKDHSSAVTETSGDANPNDQHRDSSSVDSRLSEEPPLTSTEQFRVRVCSEGDAGPASSTIDRCDQINNHAEEHRFCGSDGKSMLPELDDEGYGFEVGDMVWGKVKSHPWWPGHIYNEAFASSAVRRTKREGHVLVAFFGDSSYGWFEPAELIPFDANFAEKSKQINSRPFLKAVEEAVDEASRRCGLALVCRCRNPDNFRSTNVEGYFSVYVPDYEPGVYSNAQIKIARNSFRPIETLAFLKQLAFVPHGGDNRSISFSKNKATVSALRRALFEQYDETYAQAFGVQTLRPSDRQTNPLDQPLRRPARAPLSGPMVIAETLGAEKNSTKSVKVKDNFKKDKYLFKRRDEPTNSFQLASSEETPDAAGRYAFQKRPIALSVAPQILEKHEDTGFISQDGAASAINAKEAVAEQVQPDSSGIAPQEITLDTEPYLLGKAKESSEAKSSEVVDVASKSMGRTDFSGEMALPSIVDETSQSTYLESKTNIDVKQDGNVIVSGPHEDFQQTEHGFLTLADGGNDRHQIKSASNVVYTSPVDIKHHKPSVDGVLKKVKAHKRPANDLNSETSAVGEKKKKKRKTSLNLHPTTSGHLEKQSTTEKSVHLSGKLIGKPVSIGLAPGEDSHAEPVQVDVSASNLLPIDTVPKVNFELPQLLGDLQALALDPFYGVKRGIPAAVRQFFLRFRSLVYQKSLFLSPATENEAPEVHVIKSPSSVGASDSPDDHSRASPHVKPVKHIVRPDDPTKAGRKRALSDRQEEITAKRLKKTKDLKTLAAEKKAASHKSFEARRVEGKESMVQAPPKIVRPDSTRKVERPAKPVEPTILVIKFPPETSLPSVAELKARFARFGPIDQSGLRVFWKTSTCRVVFLHKIDAQSAYKYAVANPSLFGNVGVRCYLREFEDSSSEVAKAKGEDAANETPRMKDPAVVQRQTSVSAQQPLLQPMIQLKSILKKSTGDELGQGTGNGGSGKGTPRVKFMLGGEESSRGEQLMVGNRNNFNNASFADGGSLSPVAMDCNSKNVQKVISQPSLPNLPPPTQFTKIPQHNLHNSEMAPRNTPNFINTTASASTTSVDISQQMVSLLTRCNDVVTNLTDLLGYVPYHPL